MAVTPDGKQLLVGVGKGNQTKANPINVDTTKRQDDRRARSPGGACCRFRTSAPRCRAPSRSCRFPTRRHLAAYTETVYRNCPYSDKLLTDAPHPEKTAIPTRVGDPSPIKHVIYIIKENRTYDQVFGDLTRGNGDPSLVMFGARSRPTITSWPKSSCLLDNLYCNGHVSADGHPWSTMAYNTDYIARNWALTYSSRAGVDDDERRRPVERPFGLPLGRLRRAGLTYRSYGEYGRRVSQPDGSFRMEGAVPGPGRAHVRRSTASPRIPDAAVRDTDNVENFLKEFQRVREERQPASLHGHEPGRRPHDRHAARHVHARRPASPATTWRWAGLVEAVTHSKSWPQTAIFVIEDDAQNGPDHVDAHRTVGLVISPYTKRQALDSTQYSTVSMIRTMELILGLPPLSQYDAAARPMFASFTDKADLAPYTHEPARIDLNAVNAPTAYGAERSMKMDFSEYDRIDDFELNEILWRAIKGIDAPVPPAARRAIAYRPASSRLRPE